MRTCKVFAELITYILYHNTSRASQYYYQHHDYSQTFDTQENAYVCVHKKLR